MSKWLISAFLVVIFATPALADRVNDLQKRYTNLALQRQQISEELLRLEGAIAERRLVLKEQAEKAEEEPIEEPNQ